MRTRNKTAAVVTALGVAGTTAVAYAAIPAADGTISSCYGKGVWRVVDSTSECKSGEKPLSWNVTGPQGPIGPHGPEGQRGAPGTPGVSTGYLVGPAVDVSVSPPVVDGYPGTVLIRKRLPAGAYVLTGSVSVSSSGPTEWNCWISAGAGPVASADLSTGGSPAGAEVGTLTPTTTWGLDQPADVDLVCDRYGVSPYSVREAHLTAVELTSWLPSRSDPVPGPG